MQRFNYQYDEAGRITGIDLDGQAHRYRYDAVGRLTNALTPSGEFDYAYDPNGNRLSEGKKDDAKKAQPRQTDYRYAPSSNRLTQAGDDRYTYDQTGNPLAIGERRYEYNSTGRPTKLFIDNQLKASYQYNAWGERIKKVVYSGNQQKVTYFFYDDHQLTAEANGDGKITQQYLYLGYAPVVTFIDGELYYVHTDHLGTPRAITDEDQTVVWTAQCAPFGEAAVDEDPDRNTERVALNLRFPGQYEDLESGTYYNYQRDFDPQTGRYQTSDPIGLGGGGNTFAYVGGDPLLRLDPLGLKWESADGSVPGWLDRIIVGSATHAMFSQYITGLGRGYGTNNSYEGTFDGLRPDVYDPENRRIWELKPLSNRDEPLRSRAEAQLARYLRAANRPRDPTDIRTRNCGRWTLGASGALFKNGQELGFVRSPASGKLYRIYLYHDTRPGNTGLVFYRADLVSDPIGEFFEQVLRELANRTWILWPPLQQPEPE